MPRQRHRLTFMLLACALAVRMLIPGGWMPAATGGPLAIEPCPAAEASPIVAMTGHHHDARHHSHKAQHDGDCAFAPLTTGFAASDVPAAILTKPVAAVRPDGPAELFFATGPPALPPPATGPPAIA